MNDKGLSRKHIIEGTKVISALLVANQIRPVIVPVGVQSFLMPFQAVVGHNIRHHFGCSCVVHLQRLIAHLHLEMSCVLICELQGHVQL